MARIRTIKPEFWHSQSNARLSRNARLFFIGLWNLADDEGRCIGNPTWLAGQIFPYDEDSKQITEDSLSELATSLKIRRYETNGDQYLDIPNFLTHQRINRPTKSSLPAFTEDSLRIHGILTDDSLGERKGKEGKGKERKGKDSDSGESAVNCPKNSNGKKNKPKPPAKPDGRTSTPWGMWVDANRSRSRPDPKPLKPDLAASKTLGATITDPEELAYCYRAYLKDPLPFFSNSGWPLRHLPGAVNKYAEKFIEYKQKLADHDAELRREQQTAKPTRDTGPPIDLNATLDAIVANAKKGQAQ